MAKFPLVPVVNKEAIIGKEERQLLQQVFMLMTVPYSLVNTLISIAYLKMRSGPSMRNANTRELTKERRAITLHVL